MFSKMTDYGSFGSVNMLQIEPETSEEDSSVVDAFYQSLCYSFFSKFLITSVIRAHFLGVSQ